MDAPTETDRSLSKGCINMDVQLLPADVTSERKSDHLELQSLFYSLSTDPLGIIHVGTDGILRSLTADRKVIAAVPLEPRLIKAHLDQGEWSAELEACYRGVDSTKAPREQWFKPPPNILPPPLKGDDLEVAKKMLEEGTSCRNVMTVESAEFDPGDMTDEPRSSCRIIVVRSDFDTLPKT